jgi:sulfate transport system ATP-binding protein
MSFKVENISKNFGAEAVLQAVSLELPVQQCLSILGKSGSGKTTLLKILAGLESADAGKIWFNQEPLEQLPSRQGEWCICTKRLCCFPTSLFLKT